NKSTLTKHRDTYSFIDPYRFKNQLRGKIVVITLAHRGIGRATALTFAQAGASVCCVGPIAKSLESLIREIKEKYNTPTLALTADLLEPSAPSYIVQLTEKRFGPIDILINVAPTPYLRPFTQEPDLNAEWWPNLEHTLKSPLALIHAVLPTMIARQSGTIISTTSGSGGITFPFLSMQGVANAALIKFHHQLDLEVQSKGIFSYAVNPGPIPSYLYNPDY
ncbi:NAD(P)-binding protein, partial [Cadophora sp. DSE1049]